MTDKLGGGGRVLVQIVKAEGLERVAIGWRGGGHTTRSERATPQSAVWPEQISSIGCCWLCVCAACLLLSLTMEEFVLEFHPVQSQRMQEAFQNVHAQKHSESGDTPHGETNHGPEHTGTLHSVF